ncbi:MAG: YcaO-like family protein [Marinifilaceae bacterium]
MSESTLVNGLKTISNELGLLYHIVKMPRLNCDPNMISYGIWPANTQYLGGEKFGGRSSGCGYKWDDAILGTIGETVERYAPAFPNMEEGIHCSYSELDHKGVHPSEYALFHDEQYKDPRLNVQPFTEDVKLTWFPMRDLTNGETSYVPGQFIYMPFTRDENWVSINTSTGLAAHSNYYKAILNGLYEVIERDSFVITWMQDLVPQKIKITPEIQDYLDAHYPKHYQWHFFDITYDIEVPTVLGICFGETEYGKFVAFGSSTRISYGESLQKVIQEIGQTIPYFRFLLGEKKDWHPDDDYSSIMDFEQHSIFYVKRQDLWHIFDKWVNAEPTKVIDLYENPELTDQETIKHIVGLLKEKNYNVLFKDLTTPDIRQIGFYSIKVFVPQLVPLSGAYPLYFLGSDRLYTVPEKLGYAARDFHHLNKYPHPFP